MKFSKYDSKMVGTLYHTRAEEAVKEGLALNLTDFSRDKQKVMLLLVDPQIGFIHAGRPLCVPGAIEDTRRTIEWIYRNVEKLTYIAASLDTHLPFMIFFSTWFRKADGSPVDQFSRITLADLNKTVFPVYDFQYEYAPGKKMPWSQWYLTQLEKTQKDLLHNKQTHTIWPIHTMLGSPEHAIDPALFEAIYWHSGARKSQPNFLVKGNVPWTENYSIMETEVNYPLHPNGGVNTPFLGMLENYDLIYIAGQAKSHCVLETILSIVRYFSVKAPEVLSRVRILEDCTSSVVVPGVDFDGAANQAFAQLVKEYGLKLVKSTDPIK